MKQIHPLKILRVILAILFFCPILLFFIDFAGILPDQLHWLLEIQLIPALLSGSVIVVICLAVITLLFGRIYCSVICPAGVLQDLINRVLMIGRKKSKATRRFRYHKPINWLRYGIMAATAILALFGFMGLCLFLDPYSNFGRIASNLFRPAVIWINNILADGLSKIDNYSLYHVTVRTVNTASIIAASISLLTFILFVLFRGRLFCNTLCPVGAVLSLLSRYSLFRVSFVKDACIQCKACEKTCKSEAIETATMSVDMSRCVNCYNCLSSCKKDAIRYQLKPFWQKEAKESNSESITNSRRSFIAAGVTVAASIPVATLQSQQQKRKRQRDGSCGDSGTSPIPITPPGSMNLERFKDKCTACHLCVTQCPSDVLRPTGLEYGFDYLLKPRMSYQDSYCNYECTVCSQICPTGAITPITVEEKKVTQVGIAKFYINRCVVKTEEKDCGACSEHCPTQAVHMVPYKGTLTIPKVEPEICIGCGGCESICPVRPNRAIIVKANEVHIQAEKPKEDEKLDIEVDDFGF